MKSYKLHIGKEIEVNVRPPSKFYRSQVARCTGLFFGYDEDKKIKVPDNFVEQLDEDQFKALLKCSCDISFTDLQALDLNEGKNYEEATKIITAFFLTLGKTIR